MLYTPQIKQALDLCYSAHQGQYDKGGDPYVFHPFFVAMSMTSEEEICTALLQYAYEDGQVTEQQMRQAGFDETVIQACKLLKKPRSMDYSSYIRRLKGDPLAKKIKMADIEHNLMSGRMLDSSICAVKMMNRYQDALQILTC